MSAAALLAGLLAPLAVVVALAPSGAVARRSLRRGRPGMLRRTGSGRPGPATDAPSGPLASRWAVVLPVVEAGGRRLRRLVGRPPEPSADRRAGVAAVVAVASALGVSPGVAVPVAASTGAVPAVRARGRRRAREREVRTALPDTVDLFRLAVGAGLSVHQAVDAVALHAPPPVDATLAEIRRRVELGARLGDALDALDELGDPALPLAAALRGAARYGSPLGAALERVSADARVLRRRRAEEDARRLPVQLLFPLVLCVLPAFGLLAVVPLLLASLQSLQL
jgi:tight adherence protein C